MKNVKELMVTNILSCKKDETIQKVSNMMAQSNVGFVPVVDETQKVIGTITDRDIALAVGKMNKLPKDIKVSEIMHSEVHTVSVEADATKALEMMKEKHLGRLPVVDGEKKLKGVINIARIARNSHEEEESGMEDGNQKLMETIHSLAMGRSKIS